jgi:hypothetical protein
LSAVAFFFIGCLLDLALIYLFDCGQKGETALPTLSLWVYDSMAGHRFLAQELMMAFWAFMVLCLVINAVGAGDHQQFRIRFVYSFLFTWVLAISCAGAIALACLLPFEFMLARVEGSCLICVLIRIVLLCEIILTVGIPLWLLIRKKRRTPT